MKIIPVLLATVLAASALPVLAADDTADTAAAAVQSPSTTNSNGYLERTRELVMQALAMIGVNYKFGGNKPTEGFDCSGLVNHVFREVVGLVLPRDSQAMSKVGNKIDEVKLQPGDLVFFNTRKHPFSHVGIYIGGQRFVHAPSSGREVEVAHMRDRYWQKRYNGARRVSF